MRPEEIAAYIGAAAWLPHLGSLVYERLSRPAVRMSSAQIGEISFTSYGPILNVAVGIVVDRKPVTIEQCNCVVTHQDGDSRELVWVGLRESVSEMESNGVTTKIITDVPPTLLHVGKEATTKIFRFQEQLYKEKRNPAWFALRDYWDHLQRQNVSKTVSLARSQQMETLMSAIENSFWWKQGRYDLTLKLRTTERALKMGMQYSFNLDSFNVERLRKNITLIRQEYENMLFRDVPTHKTKPLSYYWSNVEIKPTS